MDDVDRKADRKHMIDQQSFGSLFHMKQTSIFRKFDIDVFPTYMLFDPDGKLVRKWVGNDVEKISKFIKSVQ